MVTMAARVFAMATCVCLLVVGGTQGASLRRRAGMEARAQMQMQMQMKAGGPAQNIVRLLDEVKEDVMALQRAKNATYNVAKRACDAKINKKHSVVVEKKDAIDALDKDVDGMRHNLTAVESEEAKIQAKQVDLTKDFSSRRKHLEIVRMQIKRAISAQQAAEEQHSASKKSAKRALGIIRTILGYIEQAFEKKENAASAPAPESTPLSAAMFVELGEDGDDAQDEDAIAAQEGAEFGAESQVAEENAEKDLLDSKTGTAAEVLEAAADTKNHRSKSEQIHMLLKRMEAKFTNQLAEGEKRHAEALSQHAELLKALKAQEERLANEFEKSASEPDMKGELAEQVAEVKRIKARIQTEAEKRNAAKLETMKYSKEESIVDEDCSEKAETFRKFTAESEYQLRLVEEIRTLINERLNHIHSILEEHVKEALAPASGVTGSTGSTGSTGPANVDAAAHSHQE